MDIVTIVCALCVLLSSSLVTEHTNVSVGLKLCILHTRTAMYSTGGVYIGVYFTDTILLLLSLECR